MLAEATTAELSQAKNPTDFDESRTVAREGGEIITTRREIESRTGKLIITTGNAISPEELIVSSEEMKNDIWIHERSIIE
ncbi:hypothetical protein [Victivallis vadensis]|uniref:hypothetical protein n=1 Tax=Victivallis vadensis TaxID=172901 RepID=UPI002673D25E|nr:hypothetical protein [Victivallis vadensis]